MPAANEKIDELRRLYPTIKDFMLANSPDRQLEVCNNSDKCHFGNSPTLSQLNVCYGDAAAEAWLVPQLYELGDFEGLKGQADRHQLAKTAKIIATEFYYLKTDELLLFFYRFCAGRYGQFYSYFTPSVIIRNYSADTLIPSSSKESEYGVVGSVSVFLCGFYNRMKVHECIRTEV